MTEPRFVMQARVAWETRELGERMARATDVMKFATVIMMVAAILNTTIEIIRILALGR